MGLNKFKTFVFISTLHAFFPDDDKVIQFWLRGKEKKRLLE